LLLLSIFKLLFVTLNTLVTAPVVVVASLRDERLAYRICQVWARLNLLACGVRVTTRRLAPLDPSRPYVFMSNHRSQFDILAAIAALPEFQLRWVAKKELERIPVFGWAMRSAGHIIIDRSDHRQAVATLGAAREKMARGVSVMIFPEGTRALPDEDLLPFKKGGFMLALDTGFPIVPIAIRGSADVLPSHSWRARRGTIDVVVGEPIPVGGVERDELIRRVGAFMKEHGVAQVVPGRQGLVRAEAV
jgi:1-acyl-sn-glycerol-3-phosphate acyltransferase